MYSPGSYLVSSWKVRISSPKSPHWICFSFGCFSSSPWSPDWLCFSYQCSSSSWLDSPSFLSSGSSGFGWCWESTPWLQPALLKHCKLQQKCSSKLGTQVTALSWWLHSFLVLGADFYLQALALPQGFFQRFWEKQTLPKIHPSCHSWVCQLLLKVC